MSIIKEIERARDDFTRATNGGIPKKLRLGKQQIVRFQEWAKQFTFSRDPKTGSASSWDGIPIEEVSADDLCEFV